MSDGLNRIEIILEEFEEKLFEEIEKLKPPKPEPKANKRHIHFVMDDMTYRKFKVYCIDVEMTVSDCLEELIIDFLKKNGDM
jgi:hypothetical protein